MNVDPETIDIRLALNVELVGEYPVKMKCPMTERHKDTGPSLTVYPSNVHCYGCQFHIARRYEALAFVLGIWDGRGDETVRFQAAMRAKTVAYKYVRTATDVKVAPIEKRAISQGIDKGYHKNLMSARRRNRIDSYLIGSRGLTLEWIEKMMIGHDSTRFSIPVYDANGKLVTMRFRRDDAYSDSSNKYDGVAGHNKPYLYPLNLIKQYADEEIALWVVEGEFDAIRVWQDGYPAVTVTNGSGQLHLIVSLLEEAGIRVRKLYIITDQDEAGQRGAVKLSVAAEDAGIEWTRGVWDKKLGKDYSDFRNAGGDMKEIRFGKRWCNVRRDTGKGQAIEDDCIL